MLNQVVAVGRITKVKGDGSSNEGNVCTMTIAIPRNFRNEKGEYDSDFIDCLLKDQLAESSKQYCQEGDIVGVKGRLQKAESEKEIKFIAEKITFLCSKEKDADENEES